ncbi:MAG: DMT family transporter [Clostridia bacterium]|nr:DMT family transporter [Clostridia bacterium]
MKEVKGNLILLFTALVWGVAFVFQSLGMDHMGPFSYQCLRSAIGAIALIPLVIWRIGKIRKERKDFPVKELIKSGILCGIVFTAASTLQQIGIQYTTVGKAGFLTALYILIVPVIQIFFGKKPGLKLWISIILGLAGLYLLSNAGDMSIGKGEIFIILCALVFSIHIFLIDHYSKKTDAILLSFIQVVFCAIVLSFMTVKEGTTLEDIKSGIIPLLYGGIMSVGAGYTLQMIGQSLTKPAIGSLIMSLESVFSMLAGLLFLSQIPSDREIFGAVLMFAAIVLAQLPEKRTE